MSRVLPLVALGAGCSTCFALVPRGRVCSKGYSIGSAALACFLMFGALLDEFTEFAGQPFRTVDIATPEVLVGGMLGVMMVFYFVGLSVAAVGTTAGKVVEEVRRQFDAYPEILAGTRLPDYRACVSLVRCARRKQRGRAGVAGAYAPRDAASYR